MNKFLYIKKFELSILIFIAYKINDSDKSISVETIFFYSHVYEKF